MRAALAAWSAAAVVLGVAAVQRFVTSPGVTTDVEFRTLLLAAGPALVVVGCARWVDAGRRPRDEDR